MRPFIFYILFLTVAVGAQAQSDSMPAGAVRYPTIPTFTLLKTDSSTLTRDNLKKNKNTMIMYFSPDCDHCKHQTDSMLASFNDFRDVEILMATYQPFDEMKKFYQAYDMSKYTNIKMGRDTRFFMPPFYKIKNLPFMALYNKKGKLITTFEGTTPVKKIVKAFKTAS